MMGERGVVVDHSTLNRWVIRYAPEFEKQFRRRQCPVGRSWRLDETYVKIKGQWAYLYRAGDKEGQTLSRGHQIYPVEISQVFSHFAEAKQAKANLVYAIFPDNKAPSNLYRTLAEFGVQRKAPNYRHLPLVSPSQGADS